MDDGETGFTRYVTTMEFNKYCEQNEADHKRITNAMWGSEGTNGMIKDIHDLKMWVKFAGIVLGVFVPVLSAFLSTWFIKLMGGA